jgi:hypothetical protein
VCTLILRVVTVAALLLYAEARATAQVFKFTGGASSGFQAEGAGLEVRSKNYEAWSGAGLFDGRLLFGSFIKVRFRHYTFKLGDDEVALTLPIDLFGTQSTLHTRGITMETQMMRTNFHAFLGQMGTGYASPLFRAGTSSGPLTAILVTDTVLTKKLHLFSRNIFSSAPTSISGFEWKPWRGTMFSSAVGIGTGHFYTAQAASLTSSHFDLNVGYVAAGANFQRALSGTPLQTELDGANITGVFRPTSSMNFNFGHQNYVVPAQGQQPALRAQVDRIGGSGKIDETSIGAALFRSALLNRTSRGASLWGAQSFGRLDLRVNYLVSISGTGPAQQTLSLTTQEKLTPRISVLQVTTYSAGKTSIAFGGSLTANRLSFGVSYQTYYVPFRPDHPFTQALSINLNLNLHGNVHLNTTTSFTPQGKMIYTVAGSSSYYRLSGLEATPQSQNFRFQQYLIQGKVTTPNGLPVSGAAILIGKEIVYSDSDGHFFARQRKPGRYKLEVVMARFIADGNFTVASAPEDAAATKDSDAPGIVIILNHSSE